MQFSNIIRTDIESTPEYLEQVHAEIKKLSESSDQSSVIALALLRNHERVVATELSDRAMGLCNIKFTWFFYGRFHTRDFLRAPVDEVIRLNLVEHLSGLAGVSLDQRYYFLSPADAESFYKARDAEGKPVSRLVEFERDADPVHAMVHRADLLSGSVELVNGKKIQL